MKRIVLALVLLLGSFGAVRAAQDDERLDPLFDKLYAAEDPIEVKAAEQAIWTIWLESGSPTVDLLVGGGMQAMQAEEFGKALSFFDVVVEFAPNYAEGWNKRATLHFLMGNTRASIADIEKTLALEPRHFGALSGLATIRENEKDWEAAFQAMRRAVAANPHIQGGKDKLRQLQRRAKGDPI
ncbi:tetratricopeptide repeat protein [Desertibaculum subflavum]|uniref:tetratricopeptide repeat protein n=1 Tax=Desertibaculum subflavum TaxID=2268458 RepID=UPI000E662AA9